MSAKIINDIKCVRIQKIKLENALILLHLFNCQTGYLKVFILNRKGWKIRLSGRRKNRKRDL